MGEYQTADHHWKRAALQLALSELCARNEPAYDELHYEQLGVLLSRRCHLLLALWDGLPGSRGGTDEVVRMRREGEHDVDGFVKSPLFAGAGSRLDLSLGGPVLQVVTPRDKNGGVVQVWAGSAPKPEHRPGRTPAAWEC